MYVSVESEPGLWTVGHYAPNGDWYPRSDHESPEEAAEWVGRLNGHKDEQAVKDAMLAALREVRPEISRLNRAAGETVFNPAATDMVDAAIALAEWWA